MIIKLNKSYFLTFLGCTLILICSLILLATPLPAPVKILFLPVILLAGYLQVQRNLALRSKKSIIALEPREAGLQVYFAADPDKSVMCQVVRSHVSRNLVAARLSENIGAQKHNLFVTRLMCEKGNFRVLKRYLLTRAEPVTS